MKSIRYVLLALTVMASWCMAPARATSWSNDQSDLWWNSAEDGWGIQLVQRASTMFATLFVYDASRNPTWYVATMTGTKSGGVVTFTGDLLATHGSWFGTKPYDSGSFKYDKVGTMTWQKQSGTPGTLNYDVNGVQVTKILTRQPISNDSYGGPYTAGLHLISSACLNPAKNGAVDGGGTLMVTQNGTAISMSFVGEGVNCTLNGTYDQAGQFGEIAGTYSCADGDAGTFGMSNGYVSPFAMAMRASFSSTTTGCQSTGQLGGVRTDQ